MRTRLATEDDCPGVADWRESPEEVLRTLDGQLELHGLEVVLLTGEDDSFSWVVEWRHPALVLSALAAVGATDVQLTCSDTGYTWDAEFQLAAVPGTHTMRFYRPGPQARLSLSAFSAELPDSLWRQVHQLIRPEPAPERH